VQDAGQIKFKTLFEKIKVGKYEMKKNDPGAGEDMLLIVDGA